MTRIARGKHSSPFLRGMLLIRSPSMGSRAYFIMLLITQLMKEILNNDSESPKLNVDLFHAVNQVYFAQEEQVQRNGLCSTRTKVFQLKKKRFVRESHNLLTNNEEVVNGTDSLITWERRGEPERATLRGKKWVNNFYDHRFYVTLASHGTLYWNFLFFFLNEKGDLLLIFITLDNLSAPDLREQSGSFNGRISVFCAWLSPCIPH